MLPSSALHILHFNDAYELESSVGGLPNAPVGGAARFGSLVDACRIDATASSAVSLLVTSGDHFSPSLLSVVSRGSHMVPVLSALGVGAACVGNHELDVGVEKAASLMASCDFPWLLSNLRSRVTGRALCDAQEMALLTIGPWKVGLIGLVEEGWVETLATVSAADVDWLEPVAVATRLAKELRMAGAHVVFALTHMRLPNDQLLRAGLAEAPLDSRIDLIFGGHDHDIAHVFNDSMGPPIIKSGSDFRHLTRVVIARNDGGGGGSGIAAKAVAAAATSSLSVYPHVLVLPVGIAESSSLNIAAGLMAVDSQLPRAPILASIVARFSSMIESKMKKVLGISRVPLDCRFSSVRCRETNIGNMVADLMRRAVDADIALLNSGTLRADAVIPPGFLRLKDLVSILPFFGDTGEEEE